jgi:hypothetical protein
MSKPITELLNAILDMEEESDLKQIDNAVRQRHTQLLHDRSRKIAGELRIGDRVRIGGLRPRYLEGLTGHVAGVPSAEKVPVKLDHPQFAQRYADEGGILRAPAAALTVIARAGEQPTEPKGETPTGAHGAIVEEVPFDDPETGGSGSRRRRR